MLPTIMYTAAVVGENEGPNCNSQQKAGMVNRIPCGNCPKVYIDQTNRMLKHHLTEYKRVLRSGEAAQSVVAEHVMEEAHTIKWEDGEVVNHSPRYRQRCTLEAWHIHTEQHKTNRDEGPLLALLLIHLSQPHTCYCFLTLSHCM